MGMSDEGYAEWQRMQGLKDEERWAQSMSDAAEAEANADAEFSRALEFYGGRMDEEGNPIPPWGCGKLAGYTRDGDPVPCVWGNLCEECEPCTGCDMPYKPESHVYGQKKCCPDCSHRLRSKPQDDVLCPPCQRGTHMNCCLRWNSDRCDCERCLKEIQQANADEGVSVTERSTARYAERTIQGALDEHRMQP